MHVNIVYQGLLFYLSPSNNGPQPPMLHLKRRLPGSGWLNYAFSI